MYIGLKCQGSPERESRLRDITTKLDNVQPRGEEKEQ